MTSDRQNRHTDVMYENRLTPPCKTTFPSPGRVHGNPGRVCKNLSNLKGEWVCVGGGGGPLVQILDH